MNFPKRIVFVVDVKFDDLLALFLGYLKMLKEHGSKGTIDIVITNIMNKEGAKARIHQLFSSIKCDNRPTVNYIRGNIPYKIHKSVNDTGYKKSILKFVTKPKDYEDYFQYCMNGRKFAFDDYNEKGVFKSLDDFFGKAWSKDKAPEEDYWLYLFAPYPGLEKKYITEHTKKIFVGLGYNTSFYIPPGEFFEPLKNWEGELIIMNNMSKTIYREGEGGRFSPTDKEIWGPVKEITNFFEGAKLSALKNSKEFAMDEINDLLKKIGKEQITYEDMENWEELNTIVEQINDSNVKKPGYWERVDEQIKNNKGSKKPGWDVECSDGQHMALWLKKDNLQNVNLIPLDYYIDIRPGYGYYAPTGLVRTKEKDDTKRIFIEMVEELGGKKTSSFGKKKPHRKIGWGYAVKNGKVHRVYLNRGKQVVSNGKLLGRHTTYSRKSDALKELKHTKIGKKYTKKVKMNKNYVGEYYKKEGRVRIFDRSILDRRPCAGAVKWKTASRYWIAIVGWVKVTQNKFKFKGKTYYVNTGSSFGKKPQRKKPQRRKTYKGYTLVSIKKSTNSGKKLMATFKHIQTGRTKTVHFGAKNYSDYIKHGDPQRKQRYINRHRKRENWRNPMTAGALSLYILWNKPTLKASIADYKKRFF